MEENRENQFEENNEVSTISLEEQIEDKLKLLLDTKLAQKSSRFTIILNGEILTEVYERRTYLASVRTVSMNKSQVAYGILTADHNFIALNTILPRVVSTLAKSDTYIKDLDKIVDVLEDCRVEIDDNINAVHIMSAEYLFVREKLIKEVNNTSFNRPLRVGPQILDELKTVNNVHGLFENGKLKPHTGLEALDILSSVGMTDVSLETKRIYLLANLENYSEKFEDSKRLPMKLEYRNGLDVLEIQPEERENAIDLFMEKSVRDFKSLSKIYMKQLDSKRGSRGGRGLNISYKATFFNMSVIGRNKIPSFLPIIIKERNLFNPFLENPTYVSMLATAMRDKIFTVMLSHVVVYATDFYFISQKEINSLFNHRRYSYFTRDMLQDALYYLVELNSSIYRYTGGTDVGLRREISSREYRNLSESMKDFYSEIPYREVVAERYAQELGTTKEELLSILEGRE